MVGLKKSWDGSEPRHRVNLLTSVNGGTCVYKDTAGRPWMYPIEPDGTELPIQLRTPNNNNGHMALFIRYLAMLIEDTTIVYPELTVHLDSIMSCNVTELG